MRALCARLIVFGLISALGFGACRVLSGLGDLGRTDCGTNCQAEQAEADARGRWMEYAAAAGAIAVVLGIVGVVAVPRRRDHGEDA